MKLLKIIGSLKCTCILLIVLAVLSALGTFIIQGKTIDFYQDAYGDIFGKLIFCGGLGDFYNSVIYSSMLFLLGLNLLVCTINTFKWKMFKSPRKAALFLLHTSVFLIFIGAMIGKTMRFSEHYQLLPKESIDFEEVRSSLVFNEFGIDFYPDTGQPSEYRSLVSIYEAGNKIKDVLLKVNHPVSFKGYSYYQSGFEMLADADVKVSHMGELLWQGKLVQGQPITIPGDINFELDILRFYPDVLIRDDGGVFENSYQLNNFAFLIGFLKNGKVFDNQWVFKNSKMNDQFKGQGRMFDFEIGDFDTRYATVLHVVRDPGLRFVLVGFFCLLLGMIIFIFQKN